jgi:hypothetical protein
MNKQAFIFTPEQITQINKELKTVGDWKDQLSYTIFRNNQERFKKLCGFSVSSNEVITEEELAYFEETSKEPEEESNPQRFSMLNQMFMKTLQA